MKQILNYNIHDALKFKIVRNRRHAILKNINSPFSFFETDEDIDNPDITLNGGEFVPSNNDCYVEEHKYHIKENYFYCKDSEGRARWEVEIFGFEEGSTIINFNGKCYGAGYLLLDLIAQEMFLMPMIMYRLCEKGYYLIHAGGVSNDNRAYVFAGRGGSSKTELVMDFVRSGFDYLGDDWVIIHKDKVLPSPKHFPAFVFSLKTERLPTESSSTVMDKIRYLNFLRKNLSYDSEVLKVNNLSVLKALFFIVKTNKEAISRKNIDLKEAISKLIANNQIEMIANPSIMGREFGRYHNYMLAYSFVFPDSQIAAYWDSFREGIGKNLSKVPIYEVELPQKYDSGVFESILSLMGD